MKELQKYGVVSEKRISVDKFYDIICSYQGKKGHEFETYACTFLDKNNMITFVSPNILSLVEIYYDNGIARYSTHKMEFNDICTILKPYLRKFKIKKIIYKSHG